MKIGFDLDGIFIDSPPLVPRGLLSWLYFGRQRHEKTLTFVKKLAFTVPVQNELKTPYYRFPSKFEQKIRQISHIPFFRPPISENVDFISKQKQLNRVNDNFFLITSRYQFLEKLTMQILTRYDLDSKFNQIYLNLQNKQPHIFKAEIIKDLKIDVFIDDDIQTLNYLKASCPKVKLFWYNPKGKSSTATGIDTIKNLQPVLEYIK